jgi:hypothetical protein
MLTISRARSFCCPWFHTIAGTVFARLILLPFSIKQLRNSAALAPHQPRLMKLKEELDKSYQSGDKLAVQRVALQQHKVYEESGVSMLPMLLMPFVQLPVTLGMFFGIQRLCALPLEQLHWSGVSCLPDLTLPDPYCILPIASAALMNMQLHVRASPPSAEQFLWLIPSDFYRSALVIWQRRRIARLRLTWSMPSALFWSFLSHSWAISHPYVVHLLIVTLSVAQPFFRASTYMS